MANKIWKLINSPLIVVLVALSIWPMLSAFTIHKAISKVTTDTIESVTEAFKSIKGTDEEIDEFLKMRNKLIVSNIKQTAPDWSNKEKYIATITNNYNENIKKVTINISFYDENNELIDVTSSLWINLDPILQPNESYNFSFNRDIGGQSNQTNQKIYESVKAVIKITSAEIYKK